MFFAAIAHHYVFSYLPFVNADHNIPWYRSIKSMFDVSDVRDDVADHVARVGKSVADDLGLFMDSCVAFSLTIVA